MDEFVSALSGDGQVSHRALAKLSGLSSSQVAAFARAWATLEVATRRQVSRSLVDLAEDNLELDYDDLFRVMLDDPEATVRVAAIEGLWEDERRGTADLLLRLARADADASVRASAVTSLGRYMLELELGRLDTRWGEPLADAIRHFAVDPGEALDVRRRAIEALGCLSRPEIVALIEDAYRSPDAKLRASALFAMGRSTDDRWYPILVEELTGAEAELRYEAAKALGELEDKRAVPGLVEATRDGDAEVRLASIAALGRIGGRAARQALQSLREEAKGSLRVAIDDALEELQANEDPLGVRVGEIGLN